MNDKQPDFGEVTKIFPGVSSHRLGQDGNITIYSKYCIGIDKPLPCLTLEESFKALESAIDELKGFVDRAGTMKSWVIGLDVSVKTSYHTESGILEVKVTTNNITSQ